MDPIRDPVLAAVFSIETVLERRFDGEQLFRCSSTWADFHFLNQLSLMISLLQINVDSGDDDVLSCLYVFTVNNM